MRPVGRGTMASKKLPYLRMSAAGMAQSSLAGVPRLSVLPDLEKVDWREMGEDVKLATAEMAESLIFGGSRAGTSAIVSFRMFST